MDENRFFREVAENLACDRARAEAVTLAVFRELYDRLTPKERGDVAAQLPNALRHLWMESPDDRAPTRIRADEFVGRVRKFAALPDDREAERAVRVVFSELQRLLGSATGLEGEAWDVFSVLPKELKKLWLSAHEAVAE